VGRFAVEPTLRRPVNYIRQSLPIVDLRLADRQPVPHQPMRHNSINVLALPGNMRRRLIMSRWKKAEPSRVSARVRTDPKPRTRSPKASANNPEPATPNAELRAELELILDPSTSDSARHSHTARLLRVLLPTIRRAARRALKRSPRACKILLDRDDLVQSFSLVFFIDPARFLTHFDPDKGTIDTYMAAVVWHFCRDLLKQRSSQSLACFQIDDLSLLPADHLHRGSAEAARQLVPKLLDDLGAADRDLLAKRFGLPPYDRKHTYTELAAELGKDRRTVSRQVNQLLEGLRKTFAPDCPPPDPHHEP
jgi:RNA polymerase sigma factor (sigma-70 family)